MNKYLKKCIVYFLTGVVGFTVMCHTPVRARSNTSAFTTDEISTIISDTGKTISSRNLVYGTEWEATGLARAGVRVNPSYYNSVLSVIENNEHYYSNVPSAVNNAKIIMALTAYERFLNDEPSFFTMSDTSYKITATEENTFKITAPFDAPVRVIALYYNLDNTLKAVKTQLVECNKSGENVFRTDGEKIMIWDNMENIIPLMGVYTR